MLGLVVGTVGKSVLEKAFVNSVKAIEARTAAAKKNRGRHVMSPAYSRLNLAPIAT
jgi:hypothetical protein